MYSLSRLVVETLVSRNVLLEKIRDLLLVVQQDRRQERRNGIVFLGERRCSIARVTSYHSSA